MGKALIVSHTGDGLYKAKLQPDRTAYDRQQARLVAAIAKVDDLLTALAVQISDAEGFEAGANDDLQDGIVNQAENLTTLEKEWLETVATLEGLYRTRSRLTLQKAAQELSLSELEKSAPQDATEVDLWCADFSDDLTGTVGTIEPAGDSDLGIILRPGQRSPAWNPLADGTLRDPRHMSAAEVFWNAAMLPGWQKWTPTYRIGTITALAGNSCDVLLDPVTSEAQGLNVNQTTTLQNVGVDYMDCHGAAFAVGDTVVVMFTGQEWANPQVIGFESNPRPCGLYGFKVSYRTTTGFTINGILTFNATLNEWEFRERDAIPHAVYNSWNGPGVLLSCIGIKVYCNNLLLAEFPALSSVVYAWFNATATEVIVLGYTPTGRTTLRAPLVNNRVSGPFVTTDDIPYFPALVSSVSANGVPHFDYSVVDFDTYTVTADVFVSPDSRYLCIENRLIDLTTMADVLGESHISGQASIGTIFDDDLPHFKYEPITWTTTHKTKIFTEDGLGEVIRIQTNGIPLPDNYISSLSIAGFSPPTGLIASFIIDGNYVVMDDARTLPTALKLYENGASVAAKEYPGTVYVPWPPEADWGPFDFLSKNPGDIDPAALTIDRIEDTLIPPIIPYHRSSDYIENQWKENYNGHTLVTRAASLLRPDTGETALYFRYQRWLTATATYAYMEYLSPDLQAPLTNFAEMLSLEYL